MKNERFAERLIHFHPIIQNLYFCFITLKKKIEGLNNFQQECIRYAYGQLQWPSKGGGVVSTVCWGGVYTFPPVDRIFDTRL